MKKLFISVVAIMTLMVFVGAAWAQATEPNPSAVLGGRIWTDFGYQNLSREMTVSDKEFTTTFLQVSGHSYLSGTWTNADKTTGGHIGLNVASKADDKEIVGLRYAYGWWKVGNCQLVAGQTDGWLGSLAYMPLTTFGVTQSFKSALINWGFVYSSRSPQVRLEWRSDNVGFSLAAVQPAAEQIPDVSGTDIYANIPRFDIAAEFKACGFMTTPAFGWSQLKYQGMPNNWTDRYNSWIVMLPLKYTMGPFTAKIQLHTGANTEIEYSGELQTNPAVAPKILPLWVSSGKEYDSKETGGMIALEYQIGTMIVTGGYGQVKIENGCWAPSNGYKFNNYDRKAWFIALPFGVTKNFNVSPEFQYYMYGDNMTTNNKIMGNEWLLGLQFKFMF